MLLLLSCFDGFMTFRWPFWCILNRSLDSSLAQECSDCDFSAESVVVSVVTQALSPSPTAAAEHNAEGSATSNSRAAIQALLAVLVVAVIVFFVVMKGYKPNKALDNGISGSGSGNLAFGEEEEEPRSGHVGEAAEDGDIGTVMGKARRWWRTSQAKFSTIAEDWTSSPASNATPAASREVPSSSSSFPQAELAPAREPASRVVARARKEATEQSFYDAGMQDYDKHLAASGPRDASGGVEVELTDRSGYGQPQYAKPTRPAPRLPGTSTAATMGGSSAAEKALYAAQREAFDLPSTTSSSKSTRSRGGGLFGRASRKSAAEITNELVDDTEANNPMHNNDDDDDDTSLRGGGSSGDHSSYEEAGRRYLADNGALVVEDEGHFMERGPERQDSATSSLAWNSSSAKDGSASSGKDTDVSQASDDKASLVRKPSKGIALRASAYAGVGEGSSDEDDEEEDVPLALPSSPRAPLRHEL